VLTECRFAGNRRAGTKEASPSGRNTRASNAERSTGMYPRVAPLDELSPPLAESPRHQTFHILRKQQDQQGQSETRTDGIGTEHGFGRHVFFTLTR
jgi:hypothetical protein